MAASDEVSKSPNLPPYSEMILAAISALDEKAGSTRVAISNYIELTYGDLSEDHASLLTSRLADMKDNGEILMLKNNYLRPGPAAAPAKRGRGRPPKPKPELPSDYVPPPPRPRGRPPKSKDSLAAAIAKVTSGFPHNPARPLKKARLTAAPAKAVAVPSPGGSGKRGRGRPPKVRPPAADVAA